MRQRQPILGRPEEVLLAPGERLVWQSAPAWRSLAIRVLHVRPIALYFGLIVLADMAQARSLHSGVRAIAASGVPAALTGIGVLLIAAFFAWALARTTRYTLTTRRVVMQYGLALPATLVLPLHRIAAAAVQVRGDHHGDIALRLYPGDQLGLAKLWPHARPWRIARPEPMLRDVPHAGLVTGALCRALAATADAHALALRSSVQEARRAAMS